MKTFSHLLTTALFVTSATLFAQTTTVTIRTDSTARPKRVVERVRSDLKIYAGFNGLGGALPAGYDFRPIGSRFVALAWQSRIPLAVASATKLRLITGPEVAWNNFMFEQTRGAGRNTLVEQNNQLLIVPADVELRKSKFVIAQLNLPVMLSVAFKSGFSLSAGVYAGLRLDSYTKVKPEGGTSVRTHGSYTLKPVRWGLTTELGFRGHASLFGRYEPNSPFRMGQVPDARVWTVGLKL